MYNHGYVKKCEEISETNIKSVHTHFNMHFIRWSLLIECKYQTFYEVIILCFIVKKQESLSEYPWEYLVPLRMHKKIGQKLDKNPGI